MRSFIGYPIDSAKIFDQICQYLPHGWQPAHPADRHLTLLFLGDIDDQQRDTIWAKLLSCPPPVGVYPAIKLSAFGPTNSQRTLALELSAVPVAKWMRQRSTALCRVLGREPEQGEPRPHISLAFWPGTGKPKFEPLPALPELSIALSSVALFQRAPSQADDAGRPRYHCWARTPL